MSIDSNQTNLRWFIDLDWFQQSKRSFYVIAQSRLCSNCRQQLKAGEAEKAAKILSTIGECCSNRLGFINNRLSLLESVFRLFLANNNQPLDLEALAKQLNEKRGDAYPISTEVLYLLLENDQYYGLRPLHSKSG